jgi:hypothetical protein
MHIISILGTPVARAQVPPPVAASDTCGGLCDMVSPLLWTLPFLGVLLGVAAAVFLHRSAATRAAVAWHGGGVSFASLWVLPVFASVGVVVLCAVALIAAGLARPDFMLLLLADWQQPAVALVWVGAVLGAGALPPGMAAIRTRRASLQIEG